MLYMNYVMKSKDVFNANIKINTGHLDFIIKLYTLFLISNNYHIIFFIVKLIYINLIRLIISYLLIKYCI